MTDKVKQRIEDVNIQPCEDHKNMAFLFKMPSEKDGCFGCIANAITANDFVHGTDCFHVLQLISHGQITAAKGAELIRDILSGMRPYLPNLEIYKEQR